MHLDSLPVDGQCCGPTNHLLDERSTMMNQAISVVGMFMHLTKGRCPHMDSGDVPREQPQVDLSKIEQMTYHAALNFLTSEFGAGFRSSVPVVYMGSPPKEDPDTEDTPAPVEI